MKDFTDDIKKLPLKPGVYMMRDAIDQVIYVGKAKNLKNRVSSYFKSFDSHSPKTKVLVNKIECFEYIITDTEEEALILENNLIKEYRPAYNIRLKDDKSYPYIKLSQEKFPRILKVREIKKDGGKYFGPYTSDYDVNMTIDAIRDNFKIRRTNRDMSRNYDRPCLNYYIGKCYAPCMRYIGENEYRGIVEQIELFLNGKQGELIEELNAKMLLASDNLQFEKAVYYREQIKSLSNLSIKQKVSTDEAVEQDVICMGFRDSDACIMVFFIRRGMLIGREIFTFEALEDNPSELMNQFIPQFYSQSHIPKEILFSSGVELDELYSSWLSNKSGRKVGLLIPQKGQKYQLVNMLFKNVADYMEKNFEKNRSVKNKQAEILRQLGELLEVEAEIFRIEAYDISNISGTSSVAGMVVYEEGVKKRSDYRKFSIKTVEGADDYASMAEVIKRRFKRYLQAHSDIEMNVMDKGHSKPLKQDTSFSKLPDLLVIDGGKGHVERVREVLSHLGIDVILIGLVKDNRHRTHEIYMDGKFISLKKHSTLFHFLADIQEEVHRFAISYHRKTRNANMLSSELDEIVGIGKVRKKMLLQYFKGIEAIKNATVEELIEAGLNRANAQRVYEYWRRDGLY